MTTTFSRLSRRTLLGLGSAALLAGAGCSTGGSGAGSGALTAAWYGADPVHRAMDANLAAFAAGHDGLTVTGSHAPFSDFWTSWPPRSPAARDPTSTGCRWATSPSTPTAGRCST